ncbi:MAG: hypothetical protein HYY13_10500 [Nitrospirae bacterium]|nr:hypothetical protein [Nitrospirota bacterium]
MSTSDWPLRYRVRCFLRRQVSRLEDLRIQAEADRIERELNRSVERPFPAPRPILRPAPLVS